MTGAARILGYQVGSVAPAFIQRPGHERVLGPDPRLYRARIPASTRIFRWCEIVGWVRPSGAVNSHTHASRR
jgi:hypothetical protein